MKVVTRIGALMLAVLLVAGCVKQEVATKVENDGSGTNVLEMGMSKRIVQMLQMQGEENPLDNLEELEEGLKELPEEWNARAEEFEDAQFVGVRLKTDFATLEQLAEQLNTMFDHVEPDEGDVEGRMPGANQDMDQEPLIRDVEVTQEEGLVTITATAGNEVPEEMQQQLEAMRGMMGDMSMKWSIELPELVEFSPSEAGERDGNKVTFDFEIGKLYELEIVGRLEAGEGDPPRTGPSVETDEGEIPSSGRDAEEEGDDAQEQEEGEDFERDELLEIIQGEWVFDRDALEEAMREDFGEVNERMLEQFLGLTFVVDESTMTFVDSDSRDARNYEVVKVEENRVVVRFENDEQMGFIVHGRDRISMHASGLPLPLTMTRKEE